MAHTRPALHISTRQRPPAVTPVRYRLRPSAATRSILLFQQAAACVSEGKALRAITIFSALIEIDPKDAAAYLNRGSVQGALGEKGLAMSDYSTAISLQPDLVEARYNRGTTLAHLRPY